MIERKAQPDVVRVEKTLGLNGRVTIVTRDGGQFFSIRCSSCEGVLEVRPELMEPLREAIEDILQEVRANGTRKP